MSRVPRVLRIVEVAAAMARAMPMRHVPYVLRIAEIVPLATMVNAKKARRVPIVRAIVRCVRAAMEPARHPKVVPGVPLIAGPVVAMASAITAKRVPIA